MNGRGRGGPFGQGGPVGPGGGHQLLFLGGDAFGYPNRPYRPSVESVVPPRVNIAIQFLDMCNAKTHPEAAINDISIEVVPGQKLTNDELATQADAAIVLSKYLKGQLEPDMWEGFKAKDLERRTTTDPKRDLEYKLMQCPACAGHEGNDGCPICDGEGTLVCVRKSEFDALGMVSDDDSESK